jgi:hypothetical protein
VRVDSCAAVSCVALLLLAAPLPMSASALPVAEPAPGRSAFDRRLARWLAGAGVVAAGLFFLAVIARYSTLGIDVWHEMATFREARQIGWLPLEDSFAYTPTVAPVVHHEWGTGAALLAAHEWGGLPAILALKYLLAGAMLVVGWFVARRRGGRPEVIAVCGLLAALLGQIGFTTLRAQVFTLLCLALLLWGLTENDRGRRGWLVWWLPLFAIWLNLHAGFLVGVGLCLCYYVEQLVRRKPALHLLVAGLVMFGLIAANPYGFDYYSYLWRAVRMDRPDIGEWAPLYTGPQARILLPFFLVSVGLVLVAVRERGLRELPGLLLLAASGYMALSHVRHISLYALVWWCFVPAYLRGTSLETGVLRLWYARPRWTAVACTALCLLSLAVVVHRRGWEAKLPVVREAGPVAYPRGAVDHLRASGFHGNLLVPFEVGAYVLWELAPQVKVSLDSRYEVAYPSEVYEAHRRFYRGEHDWQVTLDRYPADALLIPAASPVLAQVARLPDWHEAYRDPSYVVLRRRS